MYGTRPEAIKMAPVVHALRARPEDFEVIACTTAQHRQMADQAQAELDLTPDLDLDLMRPDQSLNDLASRALAALDDTMRSTVPSHVLVQGDTTTATAAALAGFHLGIVVGHVEAGLRTGDLARPFPEEANRRIIDVVAGLLFVPTERARAAVLSEGVNESRVHLTGNTVVDALHQVAAAQGEVAREDEVLVTIHRRESFGEPLRGVLGALRELAGAFGSTRWVLPVHPNPNVSTPVREVLGGVANVELCEPLDYRDLVRHLRRARLVLTDSGGIQEEAPTFGTPVLVLRDRTERPEGIEAGVARLVGLDPATVVAVATDLLSDEAALAAMRREVNPYGDGLAAQRIAAILAGEAYEPFAQDVA